MHANLSTIKEQNPKCNSSLTQGHFSPVRLMKTDFKCPQTNRLDH